VKQLQSLGELKVGATPGRESRKSGGRAKYVRAGDILPNGSVRSVSEASPPTKGIDALLESGDVVVRARGTPAAAVVEAITDRTYPTNDLILFRPNTAEVDPRFIVTWLNLPASRALLSAGLQSAAVSRLSVRALGDLMVPVPSLERQRKIAALAECMEVEQRLLDRLRELRRQLNQQILQRLLGNAHDEGGNPRRGSHQADHPKGGRSVLTSK
jgi:hypothetical protein